MLQGCLLLVCFHICSGWEDSRTNAWWYGHPGQLLLLMLWCCTSSWRLCQEGRRGPGEVPEKGRLGTAHPARLEIPVWFLKKKTQKDAVLRGVGGRLEFLCPYIGNLKPSEPPMSCFPACRASLGCTRAAAGSRFIMSFLTYVNGESELERCGHQSFEICFSWMGQDFGFSCQAGSPPGGGYIGGIWTHSRAPAVFLKNTPIVGSFFSF